jgi:16S rRNA processing protein RimM
MASVFPSSRRKPGSIDPQTSSGEMDPGFRRGDIKSMVLLGVIIGAHGIKGEVKLRSFTAYPRAIADYNPLETTDGDRLEIERLRPAKEDFIAILRGVRDRNRAEALRGAELFVPHERLPGLQVGEVYLADLIGMTVMSRGEKLGKVIATQNYGAGDLVEVKIPGRKETVLIPFAAGFVVDTDTEDATIEVDLPDGYLDEAG